VRRTIYTYLLIAVALHSCLGLMFSAHNLDRLQASIGSDVLVICTGAQIRFIDASEFYKTGNIVDVINNSDNPNINEYSASPCILCQLQETHSDSLLIVDKFNTFILVNTLSTFFLHIFFLDQQAYTHPLVRGPPGIAYV
jgi:hypothetical protein